MLETLILMMIIDTQLCQSSFYMLSWGKRHCFCLCITIMNKEVEKMEYVNYIICEIKFRELNVHLNQFNCHADDASFNNTSTESGRY